MTKTVVAQKIEVLKELKDFIIPLTPEEFALLETSIVNEGCKESLTVWEKPNGQLILVDGHNRFAICQKHHIRFNVRKMSFADMDEVKMWMVDNQMGRRNLTPDQMSYYRGLRYLSLKREKGGYKNVQQKGKKERSTSTMLSEKFDVSESTVKRDAKFAEGLNIIGRSNPQLKLKILSGEASVKKSDVQTLPGSPKADTLTIKNEADLYNKAKAIREELLEEVASNVRKMNEDRIDKARKSMDEREPVFLGKDDNIRKIKGMIISAMNKAINDRDVTAINELKKLIDRLADIIFE